MDRILLISCRKLLISCWILIDLLAISYQILVERYWFHDDFLWNPLRISVISIWFRMECCCVLIECYGFPIDFLAISYRFSVIMASIWIRIECHWFQSICLHFLSMFCSVISIWFRIECYGFLVKCSWFQIDFLLVS